MNPFSKSPFLSNYYEYPIYLDNKKYRSLNDVYKTYKDTPDPYNSLEAAMTFGTYIKFMDHSLKQKLLTTPDEVLYNIRSKKLRDRLLLVKNIINKIKDREW